MDAHVLVRQARIRQGLTQVELAKRAGTSQPVISAYEHGRRDPSVATLRKLIAASGARLELAVRSVSSSDIPPPEDDAEHGRRLFDVLLLADAIPSRRTGPLVAPRLVSR
jgi:transcriptional regulator with XRE-family HTH domain